MVRESCGGWGNRTDGPSGNPQALSAAVCRLLRDASAEELGRQGREWVCKHFDEREQIKQTQDLYLAALSAPRRECGARAFFGKNGNEAVAARSSDVDGRR